MSTDRLTKDHLKPYGLTRSKLGKLLADVERLETASRAAGAAYKEARMTRQALPKELTRKASEAATAGVEVDLEEEAANAETVLLAALSKANGTEDARTRAVGAVGSYLRTDDGAADREKISQILEERRTRALETLETLIGQVDELADAIAVAEVLQPTPAGGSTTLTIVPADRHPIHRATVELADAIQTAGPKAPKVPAGSGHAVAMTHAAVQR